MGSNSSAKAELDHLRSQLEEKVAMIQKSLQVWQTWEAEYEGLKEEILTLSEDEPSRDDLMVLAKEYGGSLVDETEMQTLFRGPNNTHRTRSQIVDVLSRRIDYVRQNVQTVDKQLQAAMMKLDSMSAAQKTVDEGDQTELPLTEIREDLDEEGNVILASVKSTPGSAAPEILQALEKAGITETEDGVETTADPTNFTIKGDGPAGIAEPDRQQNQVSQNSSTSSSAKPLKRKKGVRFTEDTKTEDAPSKRPLVLRPKGIPRVPPSEATTITQNGFLGQISRRLKEEQEEEQEKWSPVVVDESPEDAALRREMLAYGLSEVGAVVAELNIDEGEEDAEEEGSSDSDDEEHDFDHGEDDLDEEDQDEDDDEEEEDKYGRTTRRVISDAYIAEMEALQEKLEARHQQPQPSNTGIRPARAKEEDQKSTPTTSNTSSSSSKPPNPKKTPLSDTIVEHAPSSSATESTSTTSLRTVHEPDELDPTLMRQEIAVEYHKMRNRIIYQQGGFLHRPQDEQEEVEKVPLAPEEGGGGGETKKRVSRFKAARLGK
ncbi:MAG: hypothetical protein M1816_006165 [Peltula sp. TS41687]|nr:MAG: hypothetical protein M1816_006165 [Peltula sp. TS41687]